jgi:hypothetical protein
VTAQEFVTLLGALTALTGAVTALIVQARQTHALVNSRMTELLELTRSASRAEGQLSATVGDSPTGIGVVLPTDPVR